MKYYCDICDFQTENRSTWSHHKKSKKHIKNNLEIEGKKNSEDNIVNKIDKLKKDHEIELLKEKLKYLEKQLDETKQHFVNQLGETKQQYENLLRSTEEHYKSHIETLKNENIFQKQLINSAGDIIKKSMNTLSFL